jgi:hypothetical protein
MTPDEYEMIAKHLGLDDKAVAEFFAVNKSTAWRWRRDGPPLTVARLLRLIVHQLLPMATVNVHTSQPITQDMIDYIGR